jgi:hypothetical protein
MAYILKDSISDKDFYKAGDTNCFFQGRTNIATQNFNMEVLKTGFLYA